MFENKPGNYFIILGWERVLRQARVKGCPELLGFEPPTLRFPA